MVVKIAQEESKRKNVNKVKDEKFSVRGEQLYMDGSSIKMKSGGGSKFWYIFVDEETGLKQSIFTPTKSNLAISGLQFLKKLRNKGIDVKNIRCDNAGENKKLEEKVIDKNMKINFEYTS